MRATVSSQFSVEEACFHRSLHLAQVNKCHEQGFEAEKGLESVSANR